MADRIGRTRPRDAVVAELVPLAQDIVTAAAQPLYGNPYESFAIQYKSWQQELWTYAKAVGEYGSVMDWFAAGISRMHLTAAIRRPGQREPELIDDDKDPAVQAIHRLVMNAKDGETQFLYKWGRQLGTPGVGYFVGFQKPDGREVFDVKSAQQIRISTQPFRDARGKILLRDDGTIFTGYDVRTAPNVWEKLPLNQLVGRIFRPDDELDYEPTSWSRAALTTLREIDLLNRHIVATLLSRLVFNGLLLIPEEVTFPVNPQFKEAPDPFIAELIAVASRGIRDPGSPASAIPLPIRVPAAFVDKFQHLILATGIDPKVVEARAAAIQRLSQQLPAPPEAMEGKGDMNHWNAWKDSEDNVKMYFGPTMEILCGGIDEVYTHPILGAAGTPIDRDGGRVVCWYDASDLIVQPDNSQNIIDARERLEVRSEVYRQGLGLDEEDAPTDEERRIMMLTDMARQGIIPSEAYYLLYPDDKPDPIEQAEEQAEVNTILTDAAIAADPNAGPSGRAAVAGPSNVKQKAPDTKPTGASKPASPQNKAVSASKGG